MKFMKILYILAETYLVHLLIVINDEYDKFVKKISDKTGIYIHAKLQYLYERLYKFLNVRLFSCLIAYTNHPLINPIPLHFENKMHSFGNFMKCNISALIRTYYNTYI